jgi:hypothetical protein
MVNSASRDFAAAEWNPKGRSWIKVRPFCQAQPKTVHATFNRLSARSQAAHRAA